MRIGVEVVTRVRAPLIPTGVTGRLARDWGNAERVDFRGCSFQPLSTTEFITDREFAETHWKVIVPGRVDLISSDRIDWLGDQYEVDGDAEIWNNLQGRDNHTTVLCKRWDG